MTNRTIRKVIRKQFEAVVRPKPWWCPRFVYGLAARLVLRPVPEPKP